MKRLVGMIGVAVVASGFLGCGDEGPKPDTTTVTKDNRPAGFEDMMKNMEGNMKKAGDPKKIPK
jgi:hypothetical protein